MARSNTRRSARAATSQSRFTDMLRRWKTNRTVQHIKRTVKWEGFSFVFTFSVGLALMLADQFIPYQLVWARIAFAVAALSLGLGVILYSRKYFVAKKSKAVGQFIGVILMLVFALGTQYAVGLRTMKRVNTPAQTVEVFKPFYRIWEKNKINLGNPIAPADSEEFYQAAHEKAMVIWSRAVHSFYKLPNDASRRFEVEYDWWDDFYNKDWFDLEKRIRRFQPPAGKIPPYASVASHWDKDHKKWEWIGWMEWFCQFDRGTTFAQEFEHGKLIGPFAVSTLSNVAQVVVILNNGYWHPADFDEHDGSMPVCRMSVGTNPDNLLGQR